MPAVQKVIPLPSAKPKKKPRNMTSDGRRCVRVDVGYDQATGKRIRKAFYGKTLKEAQSKADEFKRAVADGVDMAAREQSVAQWTEHWLEAYGRKGAPGTVALHEQHARHLAAALGELKLCAVRPIHIQKYADSLSSCVQSTINSYRSITQNIFRQAVNNRILTFDPTQGVIWVGRKCGSHRALDAAEIEAITEHWREHLMGSTVMLMLFAGLRRGEALGLRWEDVDLPSGVIHVRHAQQIQPASHGFVLTAPKTATSVRDVPILPIARTVLETIARKESFVLPQFQNAGYFERAFKGFVDYLQQFMPGFNLRPHDLRHTFTSVCYDAGIDIKSAQAFLGHSTPSTTLNIYTHLSAEHRSSSVDTLAAYTSEKYGHQMGITDL